MDKTIFENYRSLFATHGDSPASLQHSSREQQFLRFVQLFNIAEDISSVVDVGCGLGDMVAFMESQGIDASYRGVDFFEGFINRAIEKHAGNSKVCFSQGDVISDASAIPSGSEFVMLSGVFNNRTENNEEHLRITLRRMFDACTRGVAFNALSTYVDYQDEHLYYYDPLKVFDYCKKEITDKVCLRHDYQLKEGIIPFEYTMYLYR
jgi:SAM-dependent methyltransferase